MQACPLTVTLVKVTLATVTVISIISFLHHAWGREIWRGEISCFLPLWMDFRSFWINGQGFIDSLVQCTHKIQWSCDLIFMEKITLLLLSKPQKI